MNEYNVHGTGGYLAGAAMGLPKANIPQKLTVFESIDQQIASHEAAIQRLQAQRRVLAAIGSVDIHTLRSALSW